MFPRTAWRLIAVSIVLFALSGAASAMRSGFEDLYILGGCADAGGGDGHCSQRRMMWAGAEAGVYLLRTPAIALALLGVLVAVLARKSGDKGADAPVKRGDVPADPPEEWGEEGQGPVLAAASEVAAPARMGRRSKKPTSRTV